jgi:hypothetical protein
VTPVASAADCSGRLRMHVRVTGALGAGGLAAVFAGLALSSSAAWIEPVGAAAHLVLLPVAAALPAPSWGRAMGLMWLGLDAALSITQINGAAPPLIFSLRLGGHVLAAVWIASTAWRQQRLRRLLGSGAAATLGLQSLIAPLVGAPGLLAVAGPLLVLWLAATSVWRGDLSDRTRRTPGADRTVRAF